MGPEGREPSRQIGSASSPLSPSSSSSSSSSDSAVFGVVQGLAGILKVAPEHQKAVQPAVELIKAQVMEIEELRGALMHVHAELSSIVDGLQDEELEVIKALQDVIYDVLDMRDDAAEATAAPDRGAAAAPAVAAATPQPAAPAAPWGTRRESEGAEALEGAKEVAALEAKGKMVAALAKL